MKTVLLFIITVVYAAMVITFYNNWYFPRNSEELVADGILYLLIALLISSLPN